MDWPAWLRRKPAQPEAPRLEPEARWVVETDDHRIAVTDTTGERREVRFDHLRGVAIETNDSGPWGADVWWLLFDSDGKLACAYPQGATGERTALDRLLQLPGFDHEELLAAMASTGNATFIVWRAESAA